LRLPPKGEQEFIVVLKAPHTQSNELKLAAFINLTLAGKENKATEKAKLQVMLVGTLGNPRVVCLKQMRDIALSENVVPLAVKAQAGS